MDPVSQGFFGAVLPQSLSKKKEIKRATLIGFIAGVIADLDVVIRSNDDPLLFIDYHRQFTHSLIFIPFGGLIAAAFLWMALRNKMKFGKILFYSTLGYGTHCFLDACTTYGTELLWPFSDERIAWNNIAVIDPLFSIPLYVFVIVAFKGKSVKTARLGLVFSIIYLIFGVYQRDRAEEYLLNIAALRGHTLEESVVFPTLGNLLLWRGVYLNNETYYVDAIRTGFFTKLKIYPGDSVKKLILENEFSELDRKSTLYMDIKRFEHFANEFLILHPKHKNIIGDLRYSKLPNSVEPLWGIKIEKRSQNNHAELVNFGNIDRKTVIKFWTMLKGRDI